MNKTKYITARHMEKKLAEKDASIVMLQKKLTTTREALQRATMGDGLNRGGGGATGRPFGHNQVYVVEVGGGGAGRMPRPGEYAGGGGGCGYTEAPPIARVFSRTDFDGKQQYLCYAAPGWFGRQNYTWTADVSEAARFKRGHSPTRPLEELLQGRTGLWRDVTIKVDLSNG